MSRLTALALSAHLECTGINVSGIMGTPLQHPPTPCNLERSETVQSLGWVNCIMNTPPDQNPERNSQFPWACLSLAGLVLLFMVCQIMPKMGSYHNSRFASARSDMSSIQTALAAFKADTGYFPTGTNALLGLLRPPAGITNWHGPYLDGIPKDPWGHDYVYKNPGRNSSCTNLVALRENYFTRERRRSKLAP